MEYAAQEAREIGQEVAQSLRRQAVDKIAGGMLFGAGAAILNNSSVLESLGIELPTLPGSGDPDISGLSIDQKTEIHKRLKQCLDDCKDNNEEFMKYREEITEFLQRIDQELTEASKDREGLTAENSRLKEQNRRLTEALETDKN